jgi:hypothetical protein
MRLKLTVIQRKLAKKNNCNPLFLLGIGLFCLHKETIK